MPQHHSLEGARAGVVAKRTLIGDEGDSGSDVDDDILEGAEKLKLEEDNDGNDSDVVATLEVEPDIAVVLPPKSRSAPAVCQRTGNTPCVINVPFPINADSSDPEDDFMEPRSSRPRVGARPVSNWSTIKTFPYDTTAEAIMPDVERYMSEHGKWTKGHTTQDGTIWR
jgi:hypothetical protein